MKNHIKHRLILSVLLIAVSSIMTGCGLLGITFGSAILDFPPEAIDIPIPEGYEDYFEHTAVDINEANTIIGYTNSSGPYANTGYETEQFAVTGFAVQADGTGYEDISADVADSTGSWPLDINDAGVVVGTYLEKLGTDSYILRAYTINDDGTGFTDLHPVGDNSSKATHINEDGRIFGVLENEFDSRAVEFDPGGGGTTMLLPTYFYSRVMAVCETWVVLYGNETETTDPVLLLYTLADDTVEELVLGGIDSIDAEIEMIKNDGTMVGWYTDTSSAQNFGDVGITFTIGDSAPRTFRGVNSVGTWDYFEYRFMDFDSNGTLVGIGYRIGPEGGLPQARAIRLDWDFTGFEDITPKNGDAYSEVYGITEDGWVAGYAGFSLAGIFGTYETTKNRGFVVRIF